MDNQTQSFLELSAKNDLVQLVADKRAAWLWSADGAQILWANAAGASFFSVHSVSELAGLSALERSPARPHIARIATTGQTDKFSIDRLRFYRGLRVMLLTCQCKRIQLDNGTSAALIVCGDKGLSLTKDPVEAFAQLLHTSGSTAFVMAGGRVQKHFGELEGVPEELALPEGQPALFGPLGLGDHFHEGALVQLPDAQRLVVLSDAPLADELTEEVSKTEERSPASITPPLPPDTDLAATPADADEENHLQDTPADPDLSAPASEEMEISASQRGAPLWVRADSEGPDEPSSPPSHQTVETNPDDSAEIETPDSAAADDTDAEEDASTESIAEALSGDDDLTPEETESVDATAVEEEESPLDKKAKTAADDLSEITDPEQGEEAEESQSARDESGDELDQPEEADAAFVFQPRRRPVRFAWKMDIDQRFTFLSDEFSEVLGPLATDIVGLTWQEVSNQFDLDPAGNIARALDRRDTWSGRTVNWPVSGEALRVPVDMAALPAFDRNRKFEGYRGFGVCRTADAIDAPEVLVLSPALAAFDEALAAEPAPESLETPEDAEEPDHLEEADPSVSDAVEDVETETAQVTDQPDDGEDRPATDVGETDAEHSNSEEADKPETQAEDSVDDLKPAQPDSFAGKTFLGASAAALVGSLARFTGKSGSEPTEKSSPSSEAEQPDNPEEIEPQSQETEFVGSALDQKLEELEAEKNASEDTSEDSRDLDQDNSSNDDAAQDEHEGSNDLPPADIHEVAEDAEQAAADEPSDKSQPSAEDEPVGINGPAELKPAEIESAVKSLAKSYKPSEKKSPDLFDENLAEQVDTSTTLVSDTDAISVANENLESAEETTSPATSSDQSKDNGTDESDENLSDEEREFFEETAAFEQEDQIAESTDSDTPAPKEQLTGQVIPLATAKPRVVPVDTSGLSRPERQAFRKIAEALGARLEGDLGDFEASDPDTEAFDELPPEAPEAGPIDPTLLDRLPIGISIVHDREVLYANKALLKMLGYSSVAALAEAGGLEALFIDDTEELPYGIGVDDEVDETMKVRLADGGVLNVDAHMHSVPWNDGQGLMISVTERAPKIASATLETPAAPNFFAEVREELDGARNQIAEMDTILETATDGVLVVDQNGSIVKVNGSAEALFSANRSDMIGEPFTEFLAPESHRAAADYLDGLSRNGVASILNDGREVLGKVPTGGLIPLFMTMGRITNGKGDAKYCAVLRDITQWKTAEEELTQAKRQAENASSQKSDFLAKISHEIRTPLNAIIGFSEVMMEERFGAIGNDRYKDYLKDIRTSGSHIMSLINDLLDLSKIEAGKLDLNFTAVSTSDVINECVALMQPQANRDRVIIRASLPDSVPDVVADPRSLRQIVLNLLSNAIKYNRSAGQVILSTALESNGEVILRVRDTGTGMTAKQLAAALEPFRQLHTASRGGGTGLGLPLTKALVEANRASFHIDSTPDQGTLVEIVFPTQRVLSE